MFTLMSTTNNTNKPFTPCNGSNLREAERGTYENVIPGISVPVITYGGRIKWSKVTILKDETIHEEKRDRFEKRNEFCHKVAAAGEFEYAIGYAPRIKNADEIIAKGGPKQIYAAKCGFCGAGHNWVVFYKRVDGSYLGYSGVDCFAEVLTNLKVPGAEAIIEAARKEEARSKKFAKIISKINDFKKDFPGVYEQREALRQKSRNPYARLWQEVEGRINNPASNGIDNDWLQDCQDGKYDRRWTYYGRPLENTLAALVEKTHEEEVTSPFYRPRPDSTPPVNAAINSQPAPARASRGIQAPTDTIIRARKLRDTGKYDWSFIVAGVALEGVVQKDSHINRINEWYAKEFEKATV